MPAFNSFHSNEFGSNFLAATPSCLKGVWSRLAPVSPFRRLRSCSNAP